MVYIDYEQAAKEIVAVLHRHKIPLAFVSKVFDAANELVKMHTIPYMPDVGEKEDN